MPGRQTERFLTTVLFTDIVGSTEVAAELGDRAWRELVQEHHRLVRQTLKLRGGREVDTAGDGFFAIFDAPAAAAECALDAIKAVQGLGIQIRAGLHVGEVEKSGPKVTGITVPIAARVMAAAGGSELLVSSTVRDLAAGSGLQFEDRGERELKGVPGTWHLYAATRRSREVDVGRTSSRDRAARRAAAVRRVEARPVWERHPRLTAGLAIGLAGVVAATAILVWSPWRPKALGGVAENSIGVIDPNRNEIVAATKVDEQPAAIAVGEGAVWVTNAESNTVSRIDATTRAVIQTIDVGKTPIGITTGHGSVWVANSGGRNVSRIDPRTNHVVDDIEVGNGPTAIAYGANAVWVTNAGDGTLSRIDAVSGAPSAPISTDSLPVALVVSSDGLWVASQDGAAVSHLDSSTGAELYAPIPVGWRPSSIALGPGALWVANAGSGSVSRIDTATGSVTGVVDVGGSPTSVALDGNTLWIADANGAVLRVDTANLSVAPARIGTSSAPQAIAIVNHEVWFASRASAASHRGGVLRVVEDSFDADPAGFTLPVFQSLIGDTLVGYPRVGGIIGSQLIPQLATAVPKPTDGGLTYTFRLRPGIRYSDGSPLHARDFVLSIERAFQVYDKRFGGSVGGGLYSAIVGADTCGAAAIGRKCDLSEGMVADDAANTLVIHLKHPDPDLLYKLALSFAKPIKPGSMPDFTYATHPFPGTGPYQIAAISAREIRMIRNPYFHSWDPHVRPDGFVDEVIWALHVSAAEQVRMVEAEKADFMVQQIPADAFHVLETEYTPQLHLAAQSTTSLFMNTKLAPFDNVDVRRAINFAVDRRAVATLRGGSEVTSVTCQILPPNFAGYQPYCPYTKDPAANGRGRWTAPDVERARMLVAASGQAGSKIVVGPFAPRLTPVAKYVVGVLKQIGFRNVTERDAKERDEVFNAIYGEKNVQMGAFEFIQDYPSPNTYLLGFTCAENGGLTNNCDPKLDAVVQQARDLQAVDPSAAADKWAEADRMVVDLALWAPLLNEGSNFVSPRVRNYQYSLSYGVLLDQIWVK